MSNKAPERLKIFGDFTALIGDDIGHLSTEWDTVIRDDIFMSSAYLELLQRCPPHNYTFRYAVIYDGVEVAGAIYFQIRPLNLSESFDVHTHSTSIWARIRTAIVKWGVSLVNHEFLVCGNVLLTGEHGFKFRPGISESDQHRIVEASIEHIRTLVRTEDRKNIRSVLLKDFYTDPSSRTNTFRSPHYAVFKVQPVMVLNIKKEWRTFDDYLAAVRSKYRVKIKKGMKKAHLVETREMTLEEMEGLETYMFELYKGTSERAMFNLFELHPSYFTELKRTFPDRVRVHGMYLEGQLLGFYTLIQTNHGGEAHFLGYDIEKNPEFELYFNMLKSLVERAIELGFDKLGLSRTALEIKSFFGAEPHQLELHLRYANPLVNRMLPFILSKSVPKKEWIQRHPFKD